GKADDIVVTVRASRDAVTLTVTDNGRGIAREDWEAALRPFERLGQEGAGRTTGSGLGLAIVQEVMKAHGGRVGFAFPADGGFAVVLTFPSTEGARIGIDNGNEQK
ncbi:MAG: ATP-binding protein, partial [Paraburkholderia sp.]|nr:ATP-binding protein [Paraburkholderia sp.]